MYAPLVRRLSREPDRWAVVELLEGIPKGQSVRGWVGTLTACLDGLDLPGGRPAPPEALAATCRDFATKPPADWNPRFFRACLAAFLRTPPAADRQSRNDAAAAEALRLIQGGGPSAA